MGGRPPPNDDGTPAEILSDQVVRVRQLLSVTETLAAGDVVVLVFPDGTGPANTHLAQVQATAPFFFAFLTATIAISEFSRANTGWEMPKEAMIKNKDVEGATWLSKLNDGYYPGDIGFDPLGLKPTDAKEFATMQEKELSNGRLAMLAAAGMIVQEQITHNPLLPLQF